MELRTRQRFDAFPMPIERDEIPQASHINLAALAGNRVAFRRRVIQRESANLPYIETTTFLRLS
jgi:hypothetical protein